MKRLALLAGPILAVAFGVGALTSAASPAPSGLRPFRGCADLGAYLQAYAAQAGRGVGVPAAAPARGAAPSAAAGDGGAADFSSTNVQEAGVDEPDLVKTDGSRLFAVAQGKLHLVDLGGGNPRELASVPLPQGFDHQLLLAGDRLLVLSHGGFALPIARGGGAPARPAIVPVAGPTTTLTELDVSDASAPRTLGALTVPGTFLAARLVGGSARVVVSSTPSIKLPPLPAKGASWIPTTTLVARGRTVKRPLVGCAQIRRPPIFAGIGLLTVLTIDLANGLPPVDTDSVMTDGQTVYASPSRLYVATQRWLPPQVEPNAAPPSVTTTIHAFDISDPERTQYRGSGSVTGYLLDQWSLSESDGLLRVASTDQPAWWPSLQRQGQSESFVTILRDADGKLVQVGRVGDIGRGERIYAVRFVGDVGYVVTFRQVDPLVTLDLSNPAQPRVRGTLELEGYSAYLHPLGGDLLLGVGRDATPDGRVLGTQLSLFDVSDLRHPVRLDRKVLGLGQSEAEFDHHAFLWWPAAKLAVIPVQTQEPDATQQFVGAIGFRVDRSGIAQLGRVSHPATQTGSAAIRRSLVAGGTLYTVSDEGLEASSLATLAQRAWLPWS